MLSIKKLIFENNDPPKILTLEDVFESFQVKYPGILEQVSEIDTKVPSGKEHVEVKLIEVDKPYLITLFYDQKQGEYVVRILELQDAENDAENKDPFKLFHVQNSFSSFIALYESLDFLKNKIVDDIANLFKKAALRAKLINKSQLDIEKEIELLYKPAFESQGISVVDFKKIGKDYKTIEILGVKNEKVFILDLEIFKDMISPRIMPVSRKSSKQIMLPTIYIINRFNGNMEDVVNHLAALVSKNI